MDEQNEQRKARNSLSPCALGSDFRKRFRQRDGAAQHDDGGQIPGGVFEVRMIFQEGGKSIQERFPRGPGGKRLSGGDESSFYPDVV